MNDEVKRAVYINLLLLAMADGKIAPAERAYIQRFVRSAGIAEAEERIWQQEIREGKDGFVSLPDTSSSREILAVLARMVRVDEAFDAAEQEAYINMGKALGFDEEALGVTLREVWNRDPEEALELFGRDRKKRSDVSILVIGDKGGDEKNQIAQSAPDSQLRFVDLRTATGPDVSSSKIVLFHLADDRNQSKEILDTLRKRLPESEICFIARRDQAPQIGWLLGLGAKRCFVEPLYPGEIDRAVDELTAG